MRKRTAFLTALALCMMALPSLAFAHDESSVVIPSDGQTIRAELIVIHASNAGKGIDDKLKKYPELKKAPFSAYDTCRLLSRKSFKFDRKGQTISLPDGGKLSIAYLGKDGAKHQVQASIKKKSGETIVPRVTLRAKGGQTFFLAGQPYQKGILVLGIRLDG